MPTNRLWVDAVINSINPRLNYFAKWQKWLVCLVS